MIPTNVTEPTAAEAFALVDQKFTDLKARGAVASEQLGELRTASEKARATFRSSLAAAEIDGTPAPSRDELDALERDATIAEDRLAGLEDAVTTFEPEWRRAKIAMLREQGRAINGEIQQVQQRIHDRESEIAALQNLNGQDAGVISNLVNQRQRRETDALDLLRG